LVKYKSDTNRVYGNLLVKSKFDTNRVYENLSVKFKFDTKQVYENLSVKSKVVTKRVYENLSVKSKFDTKGVYEIRSVVQILLKSSKNMGQSTSPCTKLAYSLAFAALHVILGFHASFKDCPLRSQTDFG
jgi:hypothetical protein